ncbi:hypothetical protein CEUSTIGMA_g7258.t1 [Chlamydomonas eustigma]|uniref:CCT domain-containing protein n=1 Tax=Chlamydomonas eustigma TaxID=1157962 RepID=A0A250X9R7_9CHLO|nr:hypothetical protein CEUSTIGMA_g7258.t1 [Chlamydomonas eustigma]|eukprot:GAX79818.1 hypothetical protein CEUSTIGMA_g7258.t1 [Chlamydomonas eustigma]
MTYFDGSRNESVWNEETSLFGSIDDDSFALDFENEDMMAFQRDCEALFYPVRETSTTYLSVCNNYESTCSPTMTAPQMPRKSFYNEQTVSSEAGSANSAHILLFPPAHDQLCRQLSSGTSPSPTYFQMLIPAAAQPAVVQMDKQFKASCTSFILPENIVLSSRQECLQRYREKKARRMFTKQVRYQLRKANADRRPRVKGRFITKDEQDRLGGLSSDVVSAQSEGKSTEEMWTCVRDSSCSSPEEVEC